MGNNDQNTGKKKKKKKTTSNSEGGLVYHKVTENADSSLSCDCREFKSTGKPCVEILAMRLHLEYGPAKPYFAPRDDELHGPPAKGKGKKKQTKGRAGSGPGKRGQRAIADHRVDKDHEMFLERIDKGWRGFDTDEEFTETEDESQPKHKKMKSAPHDEPAGTRVSSGRPAASTPLHPGRKSASPTKFSSKPGPKGRAKNSLLPPLNPKTPTKMTAKTVDNSSGDESSDERTGKPPPPTEETIKKRWAFIQGLALNFTDEELDLLDIDWNRWASEDYTLRADEVDEIASLLEALSLALKRGILVLGPSYAHEAELLRRVDWIPSDDEPIDASGAPAFPEDSVLKRAWLHSKQVTLSEILIFHHEPDRHHWLLFQADLTNDTIECYEPLSQHGDEAVDIEDIVLIAKFFKPNRGRKPKKTKREITYQVFILDIQADGASCGFWVATIALLMICEVPVRISSLATLRVLGAVNIKEHWKCLLTSWRVEDKGLGADPVNNFLTYWDVRFQVSKHGVIARRPRWIPRFDPQVILRDLNPDVAPPNPIVLDLRLPDRPILRYKDMPSSKEIEPIIQDFERIFDDMEAQNECLVFQRESLNASDLRRFLNFDTGKANDEVINIFAAVLNYTPDVGQKPPHFGSMFGLPPPSGNVKIMTSFFYIKLRELLAAENPTTGSVEKARAKKDEIIRWFKKANFDVLTNILIPTNEPAGVHWLLIEIDYRHRAIRIYDSWPAATASDIANSRYSVLLALAVLATQVISDASQDSLAPVTPEWDIRSVPIPTQDNVIDCGFFMIMVALHLVHWGSVHHPDCPPTLRLSSKTMQQTRVLLVASLVSWHAEKLPRASQEQKPLEISLVPDEDQADEPLAETSSKPDSQDNLPINSNGPIVPGMGPLEDIQPDTPCHEEPANIAPQISYSPVASSVDGEDEVELCPVQDQLDILAE
ncbi:hypothetical protein B0H19DRAFT_1166092 [Mycena capillaripes]|nr:hypothetical protein B0H19DRAFT_1166092 [Mycena capillaripes]